MVKEGSKWKRRLSGRVWIVEKVYERGPLEIEIKLPGTGEREALSEAYLTRNFEQVEDREWFCEACEGDVTTPHRANCNCANGN